MEPLLPDPPSQALPARSPSPIDERICSQAARWTSFVAVDGFSRRCTGERVMWGNILANRFCLVCSRLTNLRGAYGPVHIRQLIVHCLYLLHLCKGHIKHLVRFRVVLHTR